MNIDSDTDLVSPAVRPYRVVGRPIRRHFIDMVWWQSRGEVTGKYLWAGMRIKLWRQDADVDNVFYRIAL